MRTGPPVDVAAADSQLRISPMMLLPLVDHTIGSKSAAPDAPRSIEIRAAFTAGRLRMEIACDAGGHLAAGHAASIADIRDRLAAIYGGTGSMALTRDGERSIRAALVVPAGQTRS